VKNIFTAETQRTQRTQRTAKAKSEVFFGFLCGLRASAVKRF
jgi:hypothetical protein